MKNRDSKAPLHELLAPAGDGECLRAAVAAGADAVYFGLSAGFNARAKAPSFGVEELPSIFDYLHERCVKGYVTFNTVVFDDEISRAEELLAAISAAGADAVIVQDLGIARLARMVVPDLPIHASTQMTIASPEAASIAASLGVTRVILPRELSIDEIRSFRADSPLELECFVHGALCMSYGGQCLASEAWGGRSANRGQCAQPCRLPFDLMVDGQPVAKRGERYLLSTRDLAAHHLLGELVAAGVTAFKIEGRYKGPDYVAGAVEKYRRALDVAIAGGASALSTEDEEELALTFSRGFGPGWLRGTDHQALSHGLYPGHRGLLVGHVTEVRGHRVSVKLAPGAPSLRPGDWMVFGQGDPEGDEPKGGLFAVGEVLDGTLDVHFGQPGPDLGCVKRGDELWKSHDSALRRRLLRYLETERKVPLDLAVSGRAGEPLVVVAEDSLGRHVRVEGPMLEPARSRPLDESILRDKLASFGGTAWQSRALRLEIEGALAVSPAVLKRLRREIVEKLSGIPLDRRSRRRLATDEDEGWEIADPNVGGGPSLGGGSGGPVVIPLCRTLEQVDAALGEKVDELILDVTTPAELARAVERCRGAGVRVIVATSRIEKPGEEPIDRRFEGLQPHGVLARHLGAIAYYRDRAGDRIALYGDFSLNCANTMTGRALLGMGLSTVTPSYELDAERVERLVAGLPEGRVEIMLYQHTPLYHSQYCLYAHHLSKGRSRRDCGRPCESHDLRLRDAKGSELLVRADAQCRATIFDGGARPRWERAHTDRLLAAGVRRFRVEWLAESGEEAVRILLRCREMLG